MVQYAFLSLSFFSIVEVPLICMLAFEVLFWVVVTLQRLEKFDQNLQDKY
jgi:hypothetical protein